MAAKFDYGDAQNTATELITYFGMDAVLRRKDASPTDRPCIVVLLSQARERPNDLTNPVDRKVYLAPTAGTLDVPPDAEQDELVTFKQPPSNPPVEDEVLPFTQPVKVTAPAGISALYEFTVRR